MTQQLFSDEGVFGPDLAARTRHDCSIGIYQARGGALPRRPPAPVVRELAAGEIVRGSGWTIKSAEAEHFRPYLVCYGYRLETAAGAFVYSGDSGPAPGIRELAHRADVLVHMCHYMTGTELNARFAESCMGHMELAALAQDCGVRNLVTTHITEQFDRPGVRERVVAEMSKVYTGNLFFGEDLVEVPIDSPALAKLM